MGGRVRLSLLGTILIEMGRVPSGCHLRDSCDQQSATSGGQHGGRFWPAAGCENQTTDGRPLCGELAELQFPPPPTSFRGLRRLVVHHDVLSPHNEVPACRFCKL